MQTQVGENQTDQTAPTAATVAAPDSLTRAAATTPPQTSPAPSPPGTDTATAPPTEAAAAEDIVPEDTVRLDYEIVLRGGREEVVRVKSQLVLPMALEMENLAQTDVSFPALVDQVIVRPLVTKFRSFLQKRFDAATRARIEKEPAAVEPPFDEPPSKNVKLPKPANGAPIVMPDMSAKLPTARMPGVHPNFKQ